MTIRQFSFTPSQHIDRPLHRRLWFGGGSHPSGTTEWGSIGSSLSITLAQATPRGAVRLLASFVRSAQGVDLPVAGHQLEADYDGSEAGGTGNLY